MVAGRETSGSRPSRRTERKSSRSSASPNTTTLDPSPSSSPTTRPTTFSRSSAARKAPSSSTSRSTPTPTSSSLRSSTEGCSSRGRLEDRPRLERWSLTSGSRPAAAASRSGTVSRTSRARSPRPSLSSKSQRATTTRRMTELTRWKSIPPPRRSPSSRLALEAAALFAASATRLHRVFDLLLMTWKTQRLRRRTRTAEASCSTRHLLFLKLRLERLRPPPRTWKWAAWTKTTRLLVASLWPQCPRSLLSLLAEEARLRAAAPDVAPASPREYLPCDGAKALSAELERAGWEGHR